MVNTEDASSYDFIDPSYGSFLFMKSLYVLQESGEYKFELEYLNSHKCTVEELGLAEGEHKFWPIKKSNEKMLSAYSKGFHCVDPDALSIRGNYNS